MASRLGRRVRHALGLRDTLSAIGVALGHVLIRRGPNKGRGLTSDEAPVIIAGMHRSGTSIVTKLLERGGVYVGGSWLDENHEAVHFLRANRAMLGEGPYMLRDFGWTAPKTDEFIAARRGFAERAARGLGVFFAERRDEAAWGWKDPRNSLTLPVWLAVFPKARVLHVLRDGRAVALSLATRDGLDPAFGLDLWAHHVYRAERALLALPQERKLTVRYEDAMREPAASLQTLYAFAGVQPSASIEEITADLNAARATEPLTDPRLDGVPRHPLLDRLGYS